MSDLPFELPKSLASYVEQFEKKPEKTIIRFKKQLKRRGPDAVGFLVLAWLYYQKNEKEQALECALKAKALAPGSPFLEKAHYFFSHPKLFDAWIAPSHTTLNSTPQDPTAASDLNALIEKISGLDAKRIKIDPESNSSANHEAYDQNEVDGIVSETLAKVHEQQENYADAIRIYEILKDNRKDKTDHYQKRIQELEKLEGEE